MQSPQSTLSAVAQGTLNERKMQGMAFWAARLSRILCHVSFLHVRFDQQLSEEDNCAALSQRFSAATYQPSRAPVATSPSPRPAVNFHPGEYE